ncbi:MAG: hypothetical protein JXP34_26290 [Planctomycetes bacterium]|nr:hypothetical protein [Planctomycetota bacterium]
MTLPLVALLSIASPSAEDFQLVAPEIRVSDEGETVIATIAFTAKITWQGLSFGIQHDPAVVELTSGEPVFAFPEPFPGFIRIDILAGGATYGTVIDTFGAMSELPTLEDAPIATFTYRAAAGAKVGDVSPLAFVDGLGAPPVFVAAVAQGMSVRPQTEDGSAEIADSELFVRGDANRDDRVNIGDPVFILGCLFSSGWCGCQDAQDANDDGKVDIGDPIHILYYYFADGPAIPPPYPDPGIDPTPDFMICE